MFTSSPFYFSLIRKYVILFGTLFNNIRITRTDAAGNITFLERVPITYGPREKMLARVAQDPNINLSTAIYPLPMMSFEMTAFSYDGQRKLPTINRTAVNDTSNSANNTYQYVPVPYNIGFELSVLCKNAEDGSKIVEQILPYFTPDWTVSATLIPEMNIKHDIPVILNSINLNDAYDDDYEKRRSMIWVLNFTLKGYIYGPTRSKAIIKFANVEFFAPNDIEDGYLQTAVGNSSPVASVSVQPGLTANGQPTSNASLSVPVSQILATDDFGFVTVITDPKGPSI